MDTHLRLRSRLTTEERFHEPRTQKSHSLPASRRNHPRGLYEAARDERQQAGAGVARAGDADGRDCSWEAGHHGRYGVAPGAVLQHHTEILAEPAIILRSRDGG